MTAEERAEFCMEVIFSHAPKPGRLPIVIIIDEEDRAVFQSRFDAMMSGVRPLDAIALLTWPPDESEIHLLGKVLSNPVGVSAPVELTGRITRIIR